MAPPSSSSLAGFSIREYTARVRAADIAKCWPFSVCQGGLGEAAPESVLPPIRVVKFRWWLDELADARSRDEVGAMITLGSVARRMSSCRSAGDGGGHLGRKRRRRKKERSIVEIFAVCPLVAGRGNKSSEKIETRRRRRVSRAKEVVPEIDEVMIETHHRATFDDMVDLASPWVGLKVS